MTNPALIFYFIILQLVCAFPLPDPQSGTVTPKPTTIELGPFDLTPVFKNAGETRVMEAESHLALARNVQKTVTDLHASIPPPVFKAAEVVGNSGNGLGNLRAAWEINQAFQSALKAARKF